VSGTAYINGEFVTDLSAARLSALDAGVQHGVGLFETMLGGASEGGPGRCDGWVMMLEEHLERLSASARALGLSTALHQGALAEAVRSTLSRSGLTRARVRVTVTGGATNLLSEVRRAGAEGTDGSPAPGAAARGVPPGTVLIVATPATAYPRAMLERGVGVSVSDVKANPFNPTEGHKTLNYWWRLRELGLAAQRGCGEALVFSVTNHLCGGCVSNVFVVRGDEVFTPIARGEETRVASSERGGGGGGRGGGGGGGGGGGTGEGGAVLPSPVLPGIVREWVGHELAGEGITVTRRMLTIDDVLGADEMWLTNSSWGVLPVERVESHTISGEGAGPLGRLLIDRWERAVALASAGLE
jgi:branched-subunit amino acid aminotransferase/4-amino-4-deoxychorismate lyase